MLVRAYVTIKDGYSVELSGDHQAIEEVTRILEENNFKWNEETETYDQGFYKD